MLLHSAGSDEMQIDVSIVEVIGAVMFFILFLISAYFYGQNPKNKIPVYLSIAMMFLFIREVSYVLVDMNFLSEGFKVFGAIVSIFAGVLFLYVFIAEEKVMKDIRRIRNAFK